MQHKLHKNTTNLLLFEILGNIMKSTDFDAFRLVGGTALSLQRGHRVSIDLDLFTDASYGTIDFSKIETYLQQHWPYFDTLKDIPVGIGKSYFVGLSSVNCIKLDIYYTDTFMEEFSFREGLRLASIHEIIAMKMDVISRGGRKKDFWDIHELIEDYSLATMFELHKKRYPFDHSHEDLIYKMTDFAVADEDFDPVCLRGKHWEIIKLDLIELVDRYKVSYP